MKGKTMDFKTLTRVDNTKFRAALACVAMLLIVAVPSKASNLTDNEKSDCLTKTNAYIKQLLPTAEELAGKKIVVTVNDEVLQSSDEPDDNSTRRVVAAWNSIEPGRGSISLYTRYCKQSDAKQLATIAHEIGHQIDDLVFTGRDNDGNAPWELRRCEIAASAWAIRIYKSIGLPVSDLRSAYHKSFSDYWDSVLSYQAAQP